MAADSRAALPGPARVLIAAGRRALGTAPSKTAVATPDAGDLEAYAARHGMAAWLADVNGACAVRARAQAAEALQGIAELLGLFDLLDHAGIEALAIKGPVFSTWLYGDAGRRSSYDLDLLVPAAARDRAARLLEGAGYRMPIDASAAATLYNFTGALPLAQPGRRPIDLHWRLGTRRMALPLAVDDAFRRAIRLPLGAGSVPTLGPTDAAVFTLLHAAKHVWYSLEQVLAIAYLTRRNDVDWEDVYRAVHASGIRAGAATGLRLAADLFGAAVPSAFAESIAPRITAAPYACAMQALALPPGTFPTAADERRAHRASLDTRGAALRYTMLNALEPTPAEWRLIPLPRGLMFLYVPLRLARLATRAAVSRRVKDSR